MSTLFRCSALSLFVTLVTTACGSNPQSEDVSQQQNVSAAKMPKHMAVFGDSVVVGSFADTTMGQTLNFEQVGRLLSMMTLHMDYPKNSKEFLQRMQKLSSKPGLSAYSGDGSWSHRRRIEAARGGSLKLHNFGIAGATSETLGDEIFQARNTYGSKPVSERPDYVVLNIGANDFCEGVSVETFRQRFEFRLYQLLETHPESKVLVVGIPDVVTILTRRDDTLAFKAQGKELTCKEVREQLATCAAREVHAGSPTARVSSARAAITEMNAIMEREVNKQRSGGGSYPAFKGRMSFAKLPPTQGLLNGSQLAADCYHPNASGHELLSKLTWDRSTQQLFH